MREITYHRSQRKEESSYILSFTAFLLNKVSQHFLPALLLLFSTEITAQNFDSLPISEEASEIARDLRGSFEIERFLSGPVFEAMSQVAKKKLFLELLRKTDGDIWQHYPFFALAIDPTERAAFLSLALSKEQRYSTTLNFLSKTPQIPQEILGEAFLRMAQQEDHSLASLNQTQLIELYLKPKRQGPRAMTNVSTLTSDVERMLEDPAVAGFQEIQATWFTDLAETDPLFRNSAELIQLKIIIQRNLFLQGIADLSRQAKAARGRQEIERLLQQRNRYKKLSLFVDRSVMYAASDERFSHGQPIFGPASVLRVLRTNTERLQLLRMTPQPEKSASGLNRRRKNEAVTRLKQSLPQPKDLTLVLDAHGRDDAVHLATGLSARDLARLLTKRRGSSGRPDIVLVGACRGHTFVRRVMKYMQQLAPKRTLPIFIALAEYGQDTVAGAQNPFWQALLRGNIQTLGDLYNTTEREISVYVPDENNIPLQIL